MPTSSARCIPRRVAQGEIVHLDGRVLGTHEGIVNYTIGQRKGLGIAAAEPLYVVKLEHKTGRVIVGPREALRTHTVRLRDVNWLGDAAASKRWRRQRRAGRGQGALDPRAAAGRDPDATATRCS